MVCPALVVPELAVRAARIVVILGCCAAWAAAQDPKLPAQPSPGTSRIASSADGENLTVSIDDKGIMLEQFLSLWTSATGRSFTWSDHAQVLGRSIRVTGIATIKKADADFLFEGVIVSAGFALVPVGPPASNVFSIEPVNQSPTLKQRATFVPRDKLQSLSRSPARVYTTVFLLKHASAPAVRTALSLMLPLRNVEVVHDVMGNAVVVTGFGPTLAMMDSIVTSLDVPETVSSPEKPEEKPAKKE
jgi:hypothetical protein